MAQMCADRLSLLLELSRPVTQPVPTAAEVARVISVGVGGIVTPETVAEALDGRTRLPDEYLCAIVQHYKAPEDLFSDTEEGRESYSKLLAFQAVRDRYLDGGTNIIARGSRFTETQVNEILTFLDQENA